MSGGPDSSGETDLDTWLAQLATALGIDTDVPTDRLLDLTRVVAHTVARPAAPLTTFLVGYAAALDGGGPDAVDRAVRAALAAVDDFA